MTEVVVEKPSLVAVFDASGKEDTPCIVVAGFISSPKDWDAFDDGWTARLKQDGLDYFHMVEFAHSKKQFANGWKEDEARRQNLLADLLTIITGTVYRQFGCAIEMENFDKLSAENKKEFSLNAYALAARTCAADIRRWLDEQKWPSRTAYVFEDGDEGKGLLIKRFEKDALPTPSFKPKFEVTKDGTSKPFTPLQAADILAYEVHKPYRDVLEGKPPVKKFRWGFEELSKITGVLGHYASKDLKDLNSRLNSLGKRG